jgi:hypothetical protein
MNIDETLNNSYEFNKNMKKELQNHSINSIMNEFELMQCANDLSVLYNKRSNCTYYELNISDYKNKNALINLLRQMTKRGSSFVVEFGNYKILYDTIKWYQLDNFVMIGGLTDSTIKIEISNLHDFINF